MYQKYQRVKIRIGGLDYELETKSEKDEQIIRKASKLIDIYLNKFEIEYGITDRQKSITMLALQLASEVENFKDSDTTKQNDILRRIKNIRNLIEERK